ncbi:MAG TPA: NAD(P)/FAD-dependent oxidoreductase [Polyangiales bacterium]|jgi:NADH dehydrogenase|nr:NAD(P)/FAD-dependent oxidoreductase [Polyangiales bacterium]
MLKKEKPHVVIIGSGFGGLAVARGLKNVPVQVTLIDRNNHHVFQPLLYQVASAQLTAPDIAAPIRGLLSKQKNVRVWMSDVQLIDVTKRRIELETGEVPYDYLVLATGMVPAYFGFDSWAEHAPGLKTLSEALDVRRRIFRAFEMAELETDPVRRRAWTTFVVIGGGPTGVELAGALAEIAGRTLKRDFRAFDPRHTRVLLVEAGPRVLPSFSQYLSSQARGDLESLGIEVRTGTPVRDLGEDYVEIGDERIDTRTILWAAGVKASPLTRHLGVPIDKSGRVWVEEDLSVPDRPEVFVVGDLIAKTQDGKPLPGVAQLAMQSGKHVARQISRSVAAMPRLPFRYTDKGSLATIGRNQAVAQVGRVQLSGILAWWLWLVVHILFLVQHRSRIAVLFEWGWAYFTFQRRSRVIMELPAPLPAARLTRRDGIRKRVPLSVLPSLPEEPVATTVTPAAAKAASNSG